MFSKSSFDFFSIIFVRRNWSLLGVLDFGKWDFFLCINAILMGLCPFCVQLLSFFQEILGVLIRAVVHLMAPSPLGFLAYILPSSLDSVALEHDIVNKWIHMIPLGFVIIYILQSFMFLSLY